LTVPPLKFTASPLTLELASRVYVPEPKLRNAPAVTVKAPELVPPPVRFSVPVCTCAVVVLLNRMEIVVVPVPADFLNVPVFENVDCAPPKSLAMASSTCTSQIPLLLMVAADPVRIRPPVQVAVPAMFSVRPTVRSLVPVPLMVSVAAAGTVVVPAPVIVPDVQVNELVAVTVLVPLSAPPEIARLAVVIGEALMKFAVPALNTVEVTL
jgi:hypothetical protein